MQRRAARDKGDGGRFDRSSGSGTVRIESTAGLMWSRAVNGFGRSRRAGRWDLLERVQAQRGGASK
jgi:hypothetical protein